MPTYTVTYKIAGESAPRTHEVDAPDEAGAREVFAAQHPEHAILMVTEADTKSTSGNTAESKSQYSVAYRFPGRDRILTIPITADSQEQARDIAQQQIPGDATITGVSRTRNAAPRPKPHVSDMTQEQLRQTITAGVWRGALIAGAIMVAINFLLLMLLIAMNSGA